LKVWTTRKRPTARWRPTLAPPNKQLNWDIAHRRAPPGVLFLYFCAEGSG
jgi:hypothetical protein